MLDYWSIFGIMDGRSSRKVILSAAKEAELSKKRQDWILMRMKMEEHEKRKRQKILEYEIKRAQELAMREQSGRSSHRSIRSRSNSRSRSKSKGKSSSGSTKKPRIEEESSASSKSQIFQGPKSKIPVEELRIIKVDIRRKIPSTKREDESIVRDIDLPEAVVVARRKGEGTRPIFEREELLTTKDDDEEHRVVKTSPQKRRRSRSGSPRRHHRSKSPRPDSRYEYSRAHHSRSSYVDSHERRAKSKDRSGYKLSRRSSGDRNNRSERSHSRDRYSSSNYQRRESSYNDERSRRIDDERARRERDILPHHYIEPLPIPYYYHPGLYRPMIVDPMMPIRAPVPVPILPGGMPPMMRHPRPFYRPRFIPPNNSGSYRHPRYQGYKP